MIYPVPVTGLVPLNSSLLWKPVWETNQFVGKHTFSLWYIHVPTTFSSYHTVRPSLFEIQLIDKVLLQAATSVKHAHHKGHSISFLSHLCECTERVVALPHSGSISVGIGASGGVVVSKMLKVLMWWARSCQARYPVHRQVLYRQKSWNNNV